MTAVKWTRRATSYRTVLSATIGDATIDIEKHEGRRESERSRKSRLRYITSTAKDKYYTVAIQRPGQSAQSVGYHFDQLGEAKDAALKALNG